SSSDGLCSEMCRTKSVVPGQGGPSRTVPSCRATPRAAARSPSQGTSVKLVVPKELHSSMARNTEPYPEGRRSTGAEEVFPATGSSDCQPASSPAASRAAPTACLPRIAFPPLPPRPAWPARAGTRQTYGTQCDEQGWCAHAVAYRDYARYESP